MSRMTHTFVLSEAPQGNQFEAEFVRTKRVVDRLMLKLASDIKMAPARDRAASAANYAATEIDAELRDLSQRILRIGGNK